MNALPIRRGLQAALALFCLSAVDGHAIDSHAIEARGTPAPVHALVAQLDGDFSGLPAQDDPRFGYSVALHDGILAVGAPGTLTSSGGNVLRRGAVFLYRWEATGWTFLQRIAFGTGGDGQCGHAVALSSSFLAVGCPFHEVSGVSRGRAVFYSRNNSTDLFEDPQIFTPADASGQCGYSVAVVDSAPGTGSPLPMAAVGCPNRLFPIGGGFAANSGSVEILNWFFTWQFATTVNPSAIAGLRFGHSVALNRSGPADSPALLLIAGIPGASGNDGAARIYAMGATAAIWNEERTFTGSLDSRFGHAVHMRGHRLVIGAPERRVVNPVLQPPGTTVASGSISIASRSCPMMGGCSWTQQQNLVEIVALPLPLATPAPQNRLGESAHMLTPSRLAAGEPHFPFTTQAGRARRYSLDGATWSLAATEPFYTPAPAPATAQFGTSVAGDASWLAIGAPGFPQAVNGRVFVYGYDFDDTVFANGFECSAGAPGCR